MKMPALIPEAETTAWLRPKKSTDILVSQTATTHYLIVPLTGTREVKMSLLPLEILSSLRRQSIPSPVPLGTKPGWVQDGKASYRTWLGKVPMNIAAAGASPMESSAWEDLEKSSGPSLSPRAGSALAKTVPSLFAQPVPKTPSDAETPTSLSDHAALLVSLFWTAFINETGSVSSKPLFGTSLLLSVFLFFNYCYYFYIVEQ